MIDLLIDNAGLNFNCVEGIVPTYVSAENPTKYKPIRCGDCESPQQACLVFGAIRAKPTTGCELRFNKESEDIKKKSEALTDLAPSAVVVKN